MSWGGEGWIGAGWRAGGYSRQKIERQSQRSSLCGPNLSQPMPPAGAGRSRAGKSPGGHPPTESQQRKRTITSCPSVVLPREGCIHAPCIHTPLLQVTTPAFTFLLFSTDKEQVSAPGPKSCPIPIRASAGAPLPAPCAEPSSVPTLSSC